MKKLFPCLAALLLAALPSAPAATLYFDPADSLSVVNQSGFTGTFNPAQNYTKAIVAFEFVGLDPNPLTTPFTITNIKLFGDGITGSLSFADVTITEDNYFAATAVNLTTAINTLNFANSRVSFDVPGGGLINMGATFNVLVQYRNNSGTQVNTSENGPIYQAGVIPEPSTYALLMFFGAGMAAYVWRQRSKAHA